MCDRGDGRAQKCMQGARGGYRWLQNTHTTLARAPTATQPCSACGAKKGAAGLVMLWAAAAAVPLATLPCGLTNHTISIGGARSFSIFAPPAACGQVGHIYAVVVCLHGWRQTAHWACEAMCMPYASSYGFVALCPQGAGSGYSGWNTQPGTAWSADDMGFIRSSVAYVHNHIQIPEQRTYAVGFSFGGGLVYRLMCEASDIFAGYAVYAQPGPFSPG